MKKQYSNGYSLRKVLENSIIAIIAFVFIYQLIWKNYLLYNWRRGMSLPSRVPFLIIPGMIVLVGLLFEYYSEIKEKLK